MNNDFEGQSIHDKAGSPKATKTNLGDTSDTSKAKGKDSFVKLAMRNMVKKGSTSLFHFFLTVVGVVGTLLGLAIAFH